MSDWTPEPGDIFACFGVDAISRFISAQTALPWAPRGLRLGPSHVAIASQVVELRDRGLCWVESTSLSRRSCLVRGERVMGCQVHSIEARLSDYVDAGGRVDMYRLTPINALKSEAVRELAQDLSWYVQKRFNYDTGSAIFSGTHLLRLADKAFSFWLPSPDSVFCSQLLAAELQSLGLMNRDNPQRYNPGRLVRKLVAQGVYYRHSSVEGRRR